MRHVNVISGHPISTGFPRVDGVVNGTPENWGVTTKYIK